MASYQGHIMLSSVLGAGVGAVGSFHFGLDWGPVFLGAGLTTLGGLLPDLDSDSGVPVRELFGLAAVLVPLTLMHRLIELGLSAEQRVVVLAGLYVLIRYGAADVFKRVTVHRGMFHSVPAMLIAGLIVFLAYNNPSLFIRFYLATGTAIGFLSHLVLDEFCSVDFMGVKLKLNKFAGSALKFGSASWGSTGLTYVLLGALGYVAWLDLGAPGELPTWALQLPGVALARGPMLPGH
jgi:hypothetical protein